MLENAKKKDYYVPSLSFTFSLSDSRFFGPLIKLSGYCLLYDPVMLSNSSYSYRCETFDMKFVGEGKSIAGGNDFGEAFLMRSDRKEITGIESLIQGGFVIFVNNSNSSSTDLVRTSRYSSAIVDVTENLRMETSPLGIGQALAGAFILTFFMVAYLKAQKYLDYRRVPVYSLSLTSMSYLVLIPISLRDLFFCRSAIFSLILLLFLIAAFILRLLCESRKSREGLKIQHQTVWHLVLFISFVIQIYALFWNAMWSIYFFFICFVSVAIENGWSSRNRQNAILVIFINLVFFYFILNVVTNTVVYREAKLYLYADNVRMDMICYLGVIVAVLSGFGTFLAEDLKHSDDWKNGTVGGWKNPADDLAESFDVSGEDSSDLSGSFDQGRKRKAGGDEDDDHGLVIDDMKFGINIDEDIDLGGDNGDESGVGGEGLQDGVPEGGELGENGLGGEKLENVDEEAGLEDRGLTEEQLEEDVDVDDVLKDKGLEREPLEPAEENEGEVDQGRLENQNLEEEERSDIVEVEGAEEVDEQDEGSDDYDLETN